MEKRKGKQDGGYQESEEGIKIQPYYQQLLTALNLFKNKVGCGYACNYVNNINFNIQKNTNKIHKYK